MQAVQVLKGSYNLQGVEFSDSQIGTLSFFMKPMNRLAGSPVIAFISNTGRGSFFIGADYWGNSVTVDLFIDRGEPEEIYINEVVDFTNDATCLDPNTHEAEYDKIMDPEGWVHVVLDIYAGDDDGGNFYRLWASRWDGYWVNYHMHDGYLPTVDFFGELADAHFYFYGTPLGGGGQIGTLFRDITFVDGRLESYENFAIATDETGELTPLVYTGGIEGLGNGGWYLTGPGVVVDTDPECLRELGGVENAGRYTISTTNNSVTFDPFTEGGEVPLEHCTPQIISVPCPMFMCRYLPE